jgi:copper resistance protein C
MPRSRVSRLRRALLAAAPALVVVPALGAVFPSVARPPDPAAPTGSFAPAAEPAFHLRLERSDPEDRSIVGSPDSVRLWFSQRTELEVTRMTLKDAAGSARPIGALRRGPGDKAPVVAPVSGALAPGAYTVEWRTMAADGHVVRGSFGFTVRRAAP